MDLETNVSLRSLISAYLSASRCQFRGGDSNVEVAIGPEVGGIEARKLQDVVKEARLGKRPGELLASVNETPLAHRQLDSVLRVDFSGLWRLTREAE